MKDSDAQNGTTRPPFVILGTPRSRTFWLSRFMSYAGRSVLHEPSVNFGDLSDLSWLLNTDTVAGVVDSMLTFRWHDIVRFRPATRIVVVERLRHQVIASFMRTGIFNGHMAPSNHRLAELLYMHGLAMDALRREVPHLYVPYSMLGELHTLDLIWRYCGLPGDGVPMAWSNEWVDQRIEADIPATFARAAENAAGMRSVYPEIAHLDESA